MLINFIEITPLTAILCARPLIGESFERLDVGFLSSLDAGGPTPAATAALDMLALLTATLALAKGLCRSSSLLAWIGIALLAAGGVVGWVAHGPPAGGPSDASRTAASVPTQADRLLLHVASADPASLEAALDLAERAISEGSGRQVEVVANEGGLDLLRADVTPFADRIAELAEQDVVFFACSTAIQRLRDKGVDVRVLPQANVRYSALDRVVLRLQEGWQYQKI